MTLISLDLLININNRAPVIIKWRREMTGVGCDTYGVAGREMRRLVSPEKSSQLLEKHTAIGGVKR